jgi:hypothetical protein
MTNMVMIPITHDIRYAYFLHLIHDHDLKRSISAILCVILLIINH